MFEQFTLERTLGRQTGPLSMFSLREREGWMLRTWEAVVWIVTSDISGELVYSFSQSAVNIISCLVNRACGT